MLRVRESGDHWGVTFVYQLMFWAAAVKIQVVEFDIFLMCVRTKDQDPPSPHEFLTYE